MPSVSLRTNSRKFQEESSDLETLLLELGFLCENSDDVGSTSASFAYNAHGSMTSMPHLSAMDWDFAEKLCHITRGTTEAYYSYDGSGIRTRKVVEKNGVIETRLYLGGFEIWRKTVNGVLDTERETLHVMDDQRRIALVETLTVENGNAVANPLPVLRYQLDNHLGSASLELDESASIISYEEYYPYGDTSYRAGRTASEVSRKRYRYTGKEKDEESGLYYHGARYYACWLGRWTAADPIGIGDGLNVYMYVRGNPVKLQDPNGTESEELRYKYEAFPKPDELKDGAQKYFGSENQSISDMDGQRNKEKIDITNVIKDIAKNPVWMEKYQEYHMLSDDKKISLLETHLFKQNSELGQVFYLFALYDAYKEGSVFLDKNPNTLESLKDIKDKSGDNQIEYGFVTYAGKEKINVIKGEATSVKKLVEEYDKFQSFSDELYGVHSHKDRSIMSHIGREKGDIPHVAKNNLSKGLFMVNQEGNVFFVNKVLAKVVNGFVDSQNPKHAGYINQVYLRTIK